MQDTAPPPDSPIANPLPDPIPVVVEFARQSGAGNSVATSFRPAIVRPAADDEPTDLAIRLFPDEAEGYYLNVTTQEPAIFVHWRGMQDDNLATTASAIPTPQALLVTLSYNEAARLLDGGETVDSLPMPEEMAAWLTEYVNLHYVPEQRKKRGRNRPSFMARGEFGEMVQHEQDGLSFPKGKRPPDGDPAHE